MVEVNRDDGHVDSCTSYDTSCFVRLHCGRSYTASLVVSAGGCNSSERAVVDFDSGESFKKGARTSLSTRLLNVLSLFWIKVWEYADVYTILF